MKICSHCKGDIAIRNPSGFCDHLHYPENCPVCSMNEHAEWLDITIDAVQKALWALASAPKIESFNTVLQMQAKIIRIALQEAYELGQELGAKGKFFSSIEMNEPLPSHIYNKIYSAGFEAAKEKMIAAVVPISPWSYGQKIRTLITNLSCD
jgi:hypothetical protein